MNQNYIRNSFRLIYGVLLSIVIYSCASIGNPTGGPYDETPPRFVSSTPLPNQTNYKEKKVVIQFDELIQIESPSENVVVTPPQRITPTISTNGKKVVIELKDSLKPDVTYTIDFGNSLSDYNEKNVYQNFSFAFSTGDVIDTLEISGILLNAENLEPVSSVLIGLHDNLEDSAFVTMPFVRTSRTNDRGRFTIRNITPGSYRIYALNDANRDYTFDQPGEDIAFLDSILVPTFEFASRQDTIWKDSLTIDTIKTVNYTHFLPDNIELLLFKEKFARQYMIKPERPDERYFTLRFNSPVDTVPTPVPVNFTPEEPDWYFVQWGEGGTAINYWISDSTVWKRDTLRMQVSYPKSDSLNILRPQTDTVQIVMRRRPAEKKKKKKEDEPEPTVFLGMQVKASGTIEYFDTLAVTFDEPVLQISKELFSLEQKVDTIWNKIDFELVPDTANSLSFFIQRSWEYGGEYRLTVDSATIHSLYGKWNNTYNGEFKVKRKDEYGHLYINIQGVDVPAFVELLNSGDLPVRKAKVKDGGVLFMDLKPDKYYARIILDTNENGVWDTGKYSEKRQPEQVFYSPKMYEIPQNWEVEETWEVNATPLPKQKPLDITKNKPKETTKKKRQ